MDTERGVTTAIARSGSRLRAVVFLLFATLSWSCAQSTALYAEISGERDSMLPSRIDPGEHYLFYLHGRIIEDLGIHAVSDEYGPYQYEEILDRFRDAGFVVISEPRPPRTEVVDYARRTVGQIESLIESGVPPQNITVVGASKGAYIATLTSHLARNRDLNFVLLATCHPDSVEHMKANQIDLWGNVLAIRDRSDWELAGSCEDAFAFSEGIGRHEELVLDIGTGHGILYKPLDEWVIPTIEWAREDANE